MEWLLFIMLAMYVLPASYVGIRVICQIRAEEKAEEAALAEIRNTEV